MYSHCLWSYQALKEFSLFLQYFRRARPHVFSLFKVLPDLAEDDLSLFSSVFKALGLAGNG